MKKYYETLRLKISKLKRKGFANFRKKRLSKDDFTIISNNCWGGMIYESYNLQKNTPTVGLYFYAEDYIKFLSKMNYYLNHQIEFINVDESKWRHQFVDDNKLGTYPIGKIDDIEIFFVHYHSKQEVIEKWKRRINRINYDNLIVKFDDQNRCTVEDVKKFYELPYKNKLFFTSKDWDVPYKYIKIKQPFNKDYIRASYLPYGKTKYIDITDYINNIEK